MLNFATWLAAVSLFRPRGLAIDHVNLPVKRSVMAIAAAHSKPQPAAILHVWFRCDRRGPLDL
jgi:hypothetical protein